MIPTKETFEMTKSQNITTPAPDANVSAIDLSKIEVGSLVEVAANNPNKVFNDAEGLQVVSRIERGVHEADSGDVPFCIYYGDAGDEPFEGRQIVGHLDGYRFGLNPTVLRDNGVDTKLCRLGAEMLAAAPAIHATYPELQRLFKIWVAARPVDVDDVCREWLAYEAAYNAATDKRYTMVRFAVEFAEPRTPRGLAYKLRAQQFAMLDEGFGSDVDETADYHFARRAADQAERVADHFDPVQPEGELADLIAVHRQAQRRFIDAIDASDDAGIATSKIILMTPSRIVNGKTVAYEEVSGANPGADLDLILIEHKRWRADYNLDNLDRLAPEAAQFIRAKIDASERACLDAYQNETAPKLVELRAPYQSAIDAYHEANAAEMDALRNLLAYRPQSLDEVAALAAHLRLNESAVHDLTSEEGMIETLIATLALVGDDHADIEQAA